MTTKYVANLERGDQFIWNGIPRVVEMKNPLDTIGPEVIAQDGSNFVKKIDFDKLDGQSPVELYVMEPDGEPGMLVLPDDKEVELVDD